MAEQFERTGLPRGDLARYLRVDNAAVSRALRGQRNLNGREQLAAEAFFSVVPQGADETFIKIVRRLRSPAARARATAGLAGWLARYYSTAESLVARLLSKRALLRADQIVALARAEGIDLKILVLDGEAKQDLDAPPRGALKERVLDERLVAAARNWAPHADAIYRLGYVVEPRAGGGPRAIAGCELWAIDPVPLRPAFAYVVADDGLMPRFERGDTILFDDERPIWGPLRSNNLVAVVLARDGPRVRAVVGRLIARTGHTVIVQPTRGPMVEIDFAEVVALLEAIGVSF